MSSLYSNREEVAMQVRRRVRSAFCADVSGCWGLWLPCTVWRLSLPHIPSSDGTLVGVPAPFLLTFLDVGVYGSHALVGGCRCYTCPHTMAPWLVSQVYARGASCSQLTVDLNAWVRE
eukprot:scaffold38584_cov31-Tisochrysis_lutea.AAC.3